MRGIAAKCSLCCAWLTALGPSYSSREQLLGRRLRSVPHNPPCPQLNVLAYKSWKSKVRDRIVTIV